MFQKKKVNKLKLTSSSNNKEVTSSNTKNETQKRKLELSLNNTDSLKKNTEINNDKDSLVNKSDNEKKIYMDYEPLLCKEFKLKGYCGYGDTCKFIHSRDDYINDKKLVRKHWKKSLEDEAKNHNDKELKDEIDTVSIADKCLLCDKQFETIDDQKFVQLQCKHVFCKKCFLNSLKNENQNCKNCGTDSKGIMKPFKFIKQ